MQAQLGSNESGRAGGAAGRALREAGVMGDGGPHLEWNPEILVQPSAATQPLCA